nr:MAG TPA: hypothetical protein [Caudoviricetes sp.]
MVTVKVTVKIAYFQVKSLLVSMGTIIYRKITFYKIRVEITTEKSYRKYRSNQYQVTTERRKQQ